MTNLAINHEEPDYAAIKEKQQTHVGFVPA